MTEQAILNRIHKLYRKLRILQNQIQPIISNEN